MALRIFSLSAPDNWKIILRHQGMMGTIELERSVYSGSPSSDSATAAPVELGAQDHQAFKILKRCEK